MHQQRVTLYRDPLNERNWIVASDFGDPADEVVLSEHENYDLAAAAAEAAAQDRECGWSEEVVTIL